MMNRYELNARYDTQQSFYGKAYVVESKKNKKLYSYNTLVAKVTKNSDGYNEKLTLGRAAGYSATTMRHVREFAKQEGFEVFPKTKMIETYGVTTF